MTDKLKHYLEKLENIIDPVHYHNCQKLQKKAFNFDKVDHVPTTIYYPVPEHEWPAFDFHQIQFDFESMLLNELKPVYASAKLKDDSLYGIRANYGTGIIASMFGCPIRTFDNALPIGLHLSVSELERVLENGPPDKRAGLMGKVLDTIEYFKETLSSFEHLRNLIDFELFDIQGTFDNATIIWGSDIYYAMYDHPEKIDRLMGIITQTIAETIKEQRRIDRCSIYENGGTLNYIGGICLRQDSCVNINREQYLRFVKPYDAKLFKEFTGFCHFCGNANQWWRDLLDIDGIKAINPYQGEYYDLNSMYEICFSGKVPIVNWTTGVSPELCEKIKTGFSRVVWANDFEHALRIKEELYRTGHPEQLLLA